MKNYYLGFSILFILLGLVHIACTPIFYKSYSLDAVWFAGTGFGVALVGLINISAIKTDIKVISYYAVISNILCFILFIIIFSFIKLEVQSVAGFVLILALTVFSFISLREKN